MQMARLTSFQTVSNSSVTASSAFLFTPENKLNERLLKDAYAVKMSSPVFL